MTVYIGPEKICEHVIFFLLLLLNISKLDSSCCCHQVSTHTHKTFAKVCFAFEAQLCFLFVRLWSSIISRALYLQQSSSSHSLSLKSSSRSNFPRYIILMWLRFSFGRPAQLQITISKILEPFWSVKVRADKKEEIVETRGNWGKPPVKGIYLSAKVPTWKERRPSRRLFVELFYRRPWSLAQHTPGKTQSGRLQVFSQFWVLSSLWKEREKEIVSERNASS